MVRLDGVGLQYGPVRPGKGRVGPEVLHDLSFSIADGGFRWLLGPSGAGKTSLLRLLHLAVLPSRGRLTVMGEDIGTAERDALPRLRRRIGMVFQDFRLLPASLGLRQRRAAAAHRAGGRRDRSVRMRPRCCAGSG